MRVKVESDKAGLKLNIQKAKIMASGPITSWQIEREKVEAERNFIFLHSKTTVDSDCSYEIKRHLLFERKTIRNLYAKSRQSCLTLCDPRDRSPPVSSVSGILQARILEWVAMPSSRGSSWPRDQTHVSWKSPALAGRFFTTEPPGKPIYTLPCAK